MPHVNEEAGRVSAAATGGGAHHRPWIRAGAPLWALLLVAGGFLGCGIALGAALRSPDDAGGATTSPVAGLLTAKVEQRQITSTVIARADIVVANSIVVNPPAPDGTESAVVTGQLPKVGAMVESGDVLVEVSGRPVFVLSGKLPTYRSLGPGSSGPDVVQLRSALNNLGYRAGNKKNRDYDAALSAAVRRLYEGAGYLAPGADDGSREQAVQDAKWALADAKAIRTQALRDLKTVLKNAKAGAATAGDVAMAREAVTQAGRGVTRAQGALRQAEQQAWTSMPSGEVVFATGLPRQVEALNVAVGQVIGASDGSDPIVLSGMDLKVTMRVPASEVELLHPGDPATLESTSGKQLGAVIKLVPDPATCTSTCDVELNLDSPDETDRRELVGNVKVSVIVGASDERALVVPVAAVSSDPAGAARIELVARGTTANSPAAAVETQLVTVETGLSAEGYVEIRHASADLAAGDLVVIGVARVAGAATPTPAESPA